VESYLSRYGRVLCGPSASELTRGQVSGAAAKSIQKKFVALFNASQPDAALHSFPTPSQVCTSSIEVLRTAGLSQRKAE
jgi:DNA-3-methyladenine glycosylase II